MSSPRRHRGTASDQRAFHQGDQILPAVLPGGTALVEVEHGGDGETAHLLVWKAHRGEGWLELRGDELLVVETDDRQVVRDAEPLGLRGPVETHRCAVVEAEHPGRTYVVGQIEQLRAVRLVRDRAGAYYLASQPTAALAKYVTKTHRFGDVTVEGTHDLEVAARAYELTCELVWDPAKPPGNIGFEVHRAPKGWRHVAVGAFLEGGYAFVNRRPTFGPGGGESQTPVDRSAGRLKVRILVDHTSVELFLGDGRITHSHRVFPLAGDDRIRLFAYGGRPATKASPFASSWSASGRAGLHSSAASS